MKALILLLFLSTLSLACVCSGIISSSFNDFSSHISRKLKEQSNSLEILNKSIQENIKTLKEQNTFQKQNLALLQKESLHNQELLFLLKQRNLLE
ncbi:hypothetical protein [Helicobacter turcicus]|uniref:Lipoprotein n=1 Tax=Helicobacter turcicus TaxID=2867412 RepID=A0ABS7JP83_9HELI|nr:hypothetical protein [Helicobacter turcicus]MBX7491215.1 hypothetical protein [Helicobacter turcicus]MBX7546146.1 hypothetical protein [Helicobacter turcicus]